MLKRWSLILVGIVIVAAIPLGLYISYVSGIHGNVQAKAGRLDLRSWDFEENGTIRLNGKWEFYRNQLLEPQDFASGSAKPKLTRMVQIPGKWNAYMSEDKQPKAYGFATFRLKIDLKDQGTAIYGIRTTNIRMANKIFMNGQLVGSSGVPAAAAAAGRHGNVPYSGYASVSSGEVEIIVQVSNYVYGSGGIIYPIVFGDQMSITKSRDWSVMAELVTAIGFTIPALYFMLFYWIRRRESGLFYLGIFCLFAMLHVVTHGEKLFSVAFPAIPYEIILKLQTIIPVLGYYYLVRYGHALNELDKRKPELAFFNIGTALAIVFTIIWPVHQFAVIQTCLFTYALLTLSYGIYILFKGIRQHKGNIFYVWVSMASFMVIIVISMLNTFDLLETQLFVSYEQLLFVIMQALMLANRFNQSFNEIEQLSAKLLTIDGLRDEFMANTSHELRTPLHGMINLADSLVAGAAGTMNDKLSKDLSTIAVTGRRLSYLINDILDFAKLKNGEVTLHKRRVNLAAVVQSVLEVIVFNTGSKPVLITQSLPRDLPDLDADEDRLRQVLYNLLGNAVAYTEQGEICISASSGEGLITIEVADTGRGIAEGRMSTIFQSFDQQNEALHREYDGLGLGLSITKRLVELGGGTIEAESELDIGSVFRFTVPAAAAIIEQKTSGTTDIALLRPSTEYAADSTQPISTEGTVLIVDDLPINLQVLANILTLANYRVIQAEQGETALELLAANPQIDLMIVDWVMPGMSGLELCRTIRQRYSLFELPVLMLTAKSRESDMKAGFDAGVNDYLTKPMEAGELRARVNTLVKLRKSVQQAISSELAFLQAQIKPHFLFNALNTAIAVCPDEPGKTMQLLIELSRYLRASFNFQNKDQLASLQRELELIKSYLYLEQARFDERLKVECEIDEDCHVLIPPLSIQPIIENAIRHGIMQRAAGGTVHITIKKTESGIRVRIADDGIGMQPDRLLTVLTEDGGEGVGLKNINSRLLALFGKGLQLESIWKQGTIVQFDVPHTSRTEIFRLGGD